MDLSALTPAAVEEVQTLLAIYFSDEDGLKISLTDRNLTVDVILVGHKFRFRCPESYPGRNKEGEWIKVSCEDVEGKKGVEDVVKDVEIFANEVGGDGARDDGEPILYQVIEYTRQILTEWLKNDVKRADAEEGVDGFGERNKPEECNDHEDCGHNLPITRDESNVAKSIWVADKGILHGEVITYKKSKFQAHVAQIDTVEEAYSFWNFIRSDSKFGKATHNIFAYVVTSAENGVFGGEDDDGESKAGRRLLELLQILQAKNLAVVVSRWFGGVLLGGVRFKLIADVAKELVNKAKLS